MALNSVLNGRLTREGGFKKLYVPPAPGDEGVAIGCALYGLHRYRESFSEASTGATVISFDEPRTAAEHEHSVCEHEHSASEHEHSVCEHEHSASEHEHCASEHEHSASEHEHSVCEHEHRVVEHESEGDCGCAKPTVQSSAFTGVSFSDEDVSEALLELGPWLTARPLADEERLVEEAASLLQEGKVIAWFQGR